MNVMPMHKIILLGDSFTFGQGCEDRDHYYDTKQKKWIGHLDINDGPSNYCWGQLLQDRLGENYKVYNLSKPGASNQLMFYLFTRFLEEHTLTENDTVIFSLSPSNRILIYNDEYDIDDHLYSWSPTWIHTTDPWSNRNKKQLEEYSKFFFDERISELSTVSAVLAMYGYAMKCNANFLFSGPKDIMLTNRIHTIINDHEIPSMHDYKYGLKNNFRDNPDYLKFISADCHSNNLGHQYYFDNEIYPRIKSLYNLSD